MLFSDLLADGVFLLIQRTLILFCDVTAILRCHIVFLLANLPMLYAQCVRLGASHLPIIHCILNATVLIIKTTAVLRRARIQVISKTASSGCGIPHASAARTLEVATNYLSSCCNNDVRTVQGGCPAGIPIRSLD
jgi:hypothetical protein